jgi:carotenoid cleavage dioxygenase-like enzyme
VFAPLFKDYSTGVPIHSPEESHAKLHKWVLDLDTGAVQAKQLLDGAFERPSINLAHSGFPCRYVYLLDESSGYMGKGVLKYDLQEEREVGYLSYGDALGGEALFVARQDARAEDDGYLVDLLMKDNEAALVVFSAATLEELARIHLPARVPFGVHACWLGRERLAEMRHGE